MSDRPTLPAEMDPMRMLAEMKVPMVDVQALAAAQRRNLEALSTANRVALEGAQAIARRHMEILQQSMTEMTDAVRGVSSAGNDPSTRAAQQAEMVKATYERAVGNMKELADLIQKSNAEALTVLNRRFSEAMDEVRGMVTKKGA
ncbi:phasin family protein [Roseomonas nepalensis]|uniref:Phasin family protein n=1 Tax=Muricoccus nepalensis TaxID=1854500 RepID=A0A502G5T0_9PROT|nr:TIGR01841 family phasin [Roseomonas nepalensis]TPG57199.1 phasin family protein [Roseomonas nepalensis]